MSAAEHVSIGDVLVQLRDEFPDITISKIRFLESQGLVDPDRTPSGYRKFYEADIERLRWVLRQQKDHFLPLKVIKEELGVIDSSGGFTHTGRAEGTHPAKKRRASPPKSATGAKKAKTSGSRKRRPTRARRSKPELSPDLAAALADEAREEESTAAGGVSLTRAELAQAADLTDAELGELEGYGLVAPSPAGRDRALFDENALAVARLAAEFRKYGIEPRHLRMYRAFADREATLFDQVLLQYRRRRNPDAQERAETAWRELARLGRQLRRVLLERTR